MTNGRPAERHIQEQSRFHGCLLASAVGGALGRPVDASSWPQIESYFGRAGITQYAPDEGGSLGLITGDTQLALFTAEGLIRSWVRLQEKGITSDVAIVAKAYQRWLSAQGEAPDRTIWTAWGPPAGLLDGRAELTARRISGHTTIRALRERPAAAGNPAENSSMGTGALSRGLSVGLFGPRLPSAPVICFTLGRDLAKLTHGHERAFDATGALAALVKYLSIGVSKFAAVTMVQDLLVLLNTSKKLQQALTDAIDLASSGQPKTEAIARIGTGHIADECLAIAVYCLLATESLAEGLVASVNHGGDSDTTGTIAGGLLGAAYGDAEILPCWTEPLELRDVIREIATDLYEYPTWYGPEAVPFERIWSRYPGY